MIFISNLRGRVIGKGIMEHVINIWTKTMYGNADLSDATKKTH